MPNWCSHSFKLCIRWIKKYLYDGDHFEKHGWVIPLNDKITETILRALKCILRHYIYDWLQTEYRREFITIILKNFVNRKVFQESMDY